MKKKLLIITLLCSAISLNAFNLKSALNSVDKDKVKSAINTKELSKVYKKGKNVRVSDIKKAVDFKKAKEAIDTKKLKKSFF